MFDTGLLRLNKLNNIKQDSVSLIISGNSNQNSATQRERHTICLT
jgi:hypothetical protein